MGIERKGGPAFPITAGNQVYAAGMTLRDWFAGQALAGLVSGYWSNSDLSGVGTKDLSMDAYEYADAMLEARK